VLNPMHKSVTRLLCVKQCGAQTQHRIFFPFYIFFYEKINVSGKQGAIHPPNYLSLSLWCLPGTSAMTLLNQTAVGDSRSLWACHVQCTWHLWN